MKNISTSVNKAFHRQQKNLLHGGLLLVILAILFLRFTNLSQKPYWIDEVYTLFRLSGSTKKDIFQSLGSTLHTLQDLFPYQCIQSSTNFKDVLDGLILDDVHPPLYFFLAWLAAQILGCEPLVMRGLSACISIVFVVMVYALTQELWRSRTISMLATLFVVASPTFTIYSQEVRPYSLLMLLNVLSSWLLLRLVRGKISGGWLYYGLVSTLGLYCHTLYYLTIAIQIIYIQTLHFLNLTSPDLKLRRKQLITVAVSFGIFALWLINVVVVKYAQTSEVKVVVGANFTWNSFPFSLLFQRLCLSLSATIFDFIHPFKNILLTSVSYRPSLFSNIAEISWWQWFLISIIIGLIFSTIFYTLRQTSRQTSLFIITICLPFCLFLVKDLVFDGYSTAIIRYHLLTVLAIYLCLAYSLGSNLSLSNYPLKKFFSLILIAGIIQAELYSTINYLKAPSWWNKMNDWVLPEIVMTVEQISQPILIMDDNHKLMSRLLVLSYELDIPFQLVNPQNIPQIIEDLSSKEDYSFLFLKPSQLMKQQLQSLPKVELLPIQEQQYLYQLIIK